MTKEVYISIRGLQFEGGADAEEIESIQCGKYYKKGNTHFLLFDEMTEGFRQPTRNILRIQEHAIYLTRRGLHNTQMNFVEKTKSQSNYHTPYGELSIGLDTRRVTCEETQDRLSVEVEYALDVNYEFLSDCRIRVEARAKGAEPFRL